MLTGKLCFEVGIVGIAENAEWLWCRLERVMCEGCCCCCQLYCSALDRCHSRGSVRRLDYCKWLCFEEYLSLSELYFETNEKTFF